MQCILPLPSLQVSTSVEPPETRRGAAFGNEDPSRISVPSNRCLSPGRVLGVCSYGYAVLGVSGRVKRLCLTQPLRVHGVPRHTPPYTKRLCV